MSLHYFNHELYNKSVQYNEIHLYLEGNHFFENEKCMYSQKTYTIFPKIEVYNWVVLLILYFLEILFNKKIFHIFSYYIVNKGMVGVFQFLAIKYLAVRFLVSREISLPT